MIPNYISGKYAVGTVCFSLTDESREDTLGKGGRRKIAVRMYYPVTAESVQGAKRFPVFSENKAQAVKKAFYLKKISDEIMNAQQYDLPMMDERFPLVMFSHGYNSYVEANTLLCCDMASRGYIVASVGHANEAAENDYEDGSTDVFDASLRRRMYDRNLFLVAIDQIRLMDRRLDARQALDRFNVFQDKNCTLFKERVAEWAKDIRFAADAVKERYAQFIDTDRGTGVTGHSLGGAAAYYLCRYDDTFACGINIDGAVFGSYDGTPMTKPFCQICCRSNMNLETRPFFDTDADTYRVVFDDMQHNGFTDLKFMMPPLFVGKLDNNVLHKNLSYCHTRFFDIYLKGSHKAFVREGSKVHYKRIR